MQSKLTGTLFIQTKQNYGFAGNHEETKITNQKIKKKYRDKFSFRINSQISSSDFVQVYL